MEVEKYKEANSLIEKEVQRLNSRIEELLASVEERNSKVTLLSG